MNLGPGTYSVATAIVSTDTHLVNNYEWRDLALVFTVMNMHRPHFEGSGLARPYCQYRPPMTFLTYAQNFEDVLLWRALRHVKNGFYIDVGANDPVLHSVTKAFYDHGWSGINIEPMPSYHQVFEQQRPRDINLAVAAGAADGEHHAVRRAGHERLGLDRQRRGREHIAEGYAVVETVVPLRTLSDICAEHVRGAIHFLKIDVEGFEGEVLRGFDLQRWRPWVLVIEATLPGSRVSNHADWEALVTDHAYHYAYFDGLNRYYVADEQRALLARADLQPNVFDDFISYHLDAAWKENAALPRWRSKAQLATAEAVALRAQAEQQAAAAIQAQLSAGSAIASLGQAVNTLESVLSQAQQRLETSEREAEQLKARVAAYQQMEQWANGLQQRLVQIETSLTWRAILSLRHVTQLPRKLYARSRNGARLVLRRISSNERARRLLMPLKKRFPAVTERLMQISRQQASPQVKYRPRLPIWPFQPNWQHCRCRCAPCWPTWPRPCTLLHDNSLCVSSSICKPARTAAIPFHPARQRKRWPRRRNWPAVPARTRSGSCCRQASLTSWNNCAPRSAACCPPDRCALTMCR